MDWVLDVRERLRLRMKISFLVWDIGRILLLFIELKENVGRVGESVNWYLSEFVK